MAEVEVAPAESPFARWASDRGYCIAPAVLPDSNRVYADSRTQEIYDAYSLGVSHASKDIMRAMVAGLSAEELASAGIV